MSRVSKAALDGGEDKEDKEGKERIEKPLNAAGNARKLLLDASREGVLEGRTLQRELRPGAETGGEKSLKFVDQECGLESEDAAGDSTGRTTTGPRTVTRTPRWRAGSVSDACLSISPAAGNR